MMDLDGLRSVSQQSPLCALSLFRLSLSHFGEHLRGIVWSYRQEGFAVGHTCLGFAIIELRDIEQVTKCL